MIATDFVIAPELLQLLSPEQAWHYRVVPLELRGGKVMLITDGRLDIETELQIILGYDISLSFRETEEISRYLSANYQRSSGRVTAMHYSEDFLERILISAKGTGSSDIHFEPYESHARVRFRLDGKLKEQFRIPVEEYPVIINKIKIRAQLDISEKRLPQDGRITVATEHDEFDIRVSVMPTLYGEKTVLRILSKDTSHLDLHAVGFTEKEFAIYLEGIRKPNGIVLISGPTGSGKTTTLYATLKHLNQPSTNILTVEDPIEYTLEGINQVQLRENIGLDFAATMRSFLRQDPDIIMVGEIRDIATANMAIRAALTGHLVLSTIHTNSAWATVSRLIDMGIPPFLIAGTLNLSVAQRLVRKLCTCKVKHEVSRGLFPTGFMIPAWLTHHYVAVGCDSCHYTGYSGRKAVYELLPIDKELMSHIKANAHDVDYYIKEKDLATLKDNAVLLIKEGVTSVDEAFALLMN